LNGKVSVIIPARDEANSIGSAMTLSHDRSLGKGAAMKSGAGSATGDIFVFLDGAGAHYPEDIPSVIAPILQNKADLIIGSRNFHVLAYYLTINQGCDPDKPRNLAKSVTLK